MVLKLKHSENRS